MLYRFGNRMHPCRTPFQMLNQSLLPYSVFTVPFWSTYKFLMDSTRCCGIPTSCRTNVPESCMIYTAESFAAVYKAEKIFFLKFSCFLHDAAKICNLVTRSSSLSESCLCFWTHSLQYSRFLRWISC